MDLFNDLADEALVAVRGKNGSFVKRDVAMKLLDSLRALEGSGSPEVVAFLDRMAVNGMTTWVSGWLRKNAIETRTRKGAPVELPAHAGLRNEDGEFEQMPLMGMDVESLRRHKEKLERTRNTLSREVAVLNDLVAAMEADSKLRTVADAFRKLGLAA